MRILILNWRDPMHPLAGGAEKSVFEHALYWKNKGAQVSWFASSFKNAKNNELIKGIKIIRKGSHYSVHLHFMLDALRGKFSKTDLIIDCFHFLPFFTPIFMPKKKKLALIQETGGKLWFENIIFPFSLIGFIVEPLFFLFYKGVDFITASESTKEDLIKFGIDKKKIYIVPHGVDRILSSAKKEEKPTILYLGLLTKDKGFEDASEAAAIVKKQIPDLQFWIAGKESKKGDYNWYIGRARKFAKYFGFVTEQEKFDLYKKAWILIHPSEKEGWGLTVVEAATQSTPTVGYDVPGLRDSVKNGKTGILVEKQILLLANAIVSALKNEKILKNLSLEANKWSKNFDWEKAGKKSWDILNS